MNFDFSHVIVTLGHHTGYTNINVYHYSHWYKERAHCREHNISLILIVTTFTFAFFARVVVPIDEMNRGKYIWINPFYTVLYLMENGDCVPTYSLVRNKCKSLGTKISFILIDGNDIEIIM